MKKEDAEWLTLNMGNELNYFRGQPINEALFIKVKEYVKNKLQYYISTNQISDYSDLDNLFKINFNSSPGVLTIEWIVKE